MKLNKLRKIAIILVLIAIPAWYVLNDMRQAEHMAADACSRAVQGMSLDEYFSGFPQKDYRIALTESECVLIPKGSMGCCRCVIFHDGRVITGSKTSFLLRR